MNIDTFTIVASVAAIVVSIIGTGAGVVAIIRPGITEIRRDVADLRERMARLEGLFEGFTRREPPAAS